MQLSTHRQRRESPMRIHTHTHTHDFLRHASSSRKRLPPPPPFFPPSPMSWVRTAAAQPAGHTLFLCRPTLNPHTIRPHTHTHTLTHTDKTHTHTRVHFHLSQSLIRTPLSARHCSPRLRHCVLWDCCRASQNSTKKVVTAKAAATAVVVSERVRTCVRVCVCML